ncbi:Transmembrane Channel-Like Protein 2 [Manis pentadactyla]|nr:Transmembrane Channel-Like Protein 2 [Manis pentadactyla]
MKRLFTLRKMNPDLLCEGMSAPLSADGSQLGCSRVLRARLKSRARGGWPVRRPKRSAPDADALGVRSAGRRAAHVGAGGPAAAGYARTGPGWRAAGAPSRGNLLTRTPPPAPGPRRAAFRCGGR